MSRTGAAGRIALVLGLLVAAVAAVVVTFTGAPDEPPPRAVNRFGSLVDAALKDWETNIGNAEGAPQQQVVNGWVARDLLHLIAEQDRAIAKAELSVASDDRPTYLLLIGVLTLCWSAAWLAVLSAGSRGNSGRVLPPPNAPNDETTSLAPVALADD